MELNLNKHFAALKKYCACFQQVLMQIDTKCRFEKGSFVTRWTRRTSTMAAQTIFTMSTAD